MMAHMEIIDAKLNACLQGFVTECARAADLAQTPAGKRLVEAERALDDCDDPAERVAVLHWYRAAWAAYALSRGWVVETESLKVAFDAAVRAA